MQRTITGEIEGRGIVYNMRSSRKVIAVDFDGTLCVSKWPEIGAPRADVIERLRREQDRGARLILWTCRTGKELERAVHWAREQGIRFDAVNENLPEKIAQYGHNCRKISADEYWDDRAREV